MDLFAKAKEELSKVNKTSASGEIIDSNGVSDDNNSNEIELGDIGEKKKYKCCNCDNKSDDKQYFSNPNFLEINEKPFCHECLIKRRESGNKVSDEFINKVFNGDVFSFLSNPKLENEIFDCVCSDPPFENGDVGYGRKGKIILNDNDDTINFRYLEAVYPKMKDGASLYLFCDHKMSDKIKQYAVEKCSYKYINTLVYVKNHFGMGHPFRLQHEFVLVFSKNESTFFSTNMSNVLFAGHVRHDDRNIGSKIESHPHQKDIDVLRKIIRHSTRPDEILFDGFSGSNSLGIACLREGRRFVSTELDKKWWELGQKLLQAEQSKISMF